MAFCMHCGRPLPDNASTCAGCGSPVGEHADAGGHGQVEDLAQSGQMIEAIKAYRKQTGASLSEAKEAVEEWLRVGNWPQPSTYRSASLSLEVQQLAREGRKIEAIKVYREQSGVSLATAKQAVEDWMKSQGLVTTGGRGCATSVLSLLIGLGVLLSIPFAAVDLIR